MLQVLLYAIPRVAVRGQTGTISAVVRRPGGPYLARVMDPAGPGAPPGDRARGRGRSGRLESALAILALGFLTWFAACEINDERRSVADDAFITYVYGRNVAEGHGPRFNASDAEPTSGCSTTLHMGLSALAIRAGLDPLVATRVLSLASLLVLAVVLGWAAARLTRAPPSAGILTGACAAFLWLLLPETTVHLAWGMETMLTVAAHACAVAWAIAMVAREGPPSLAVSAFSLVPLGLLLLARPEGGWLGAGYVAAILAARGTRTSLRTEARAHAALIVLFLCCVGGLLAWRKLTFGDFLANPYYVKSANRIYGSEGSALPGLREVASFALLRAAPLLALVALLAAGLRVSGPVRRQAALLLFPSALVLLLYARAIHEMAGGFRYEDPLLVPLVAALIAGVLALRERSRGGYAAALVGGAVCVPLLASPAISPLTHRLAHPRVLATQWLDPQPADNALARLGLDLQSTGLGQRATILLDAAGQIPWYSRFRCIDWIGLNDWHLSGRTALGLDEVWAYIDAQHPDLVQSILPPASPLAGSLEEDTNFRSENVQRTLMGRGSGLFAQWNRSKLEAMFWREMQYIRDRCEFGACYKLGDAWGDDWWVFVYVRRDSPHREALLKTLRESKRTDKSSDLGRVFAFDPRALVQ
jgi:hypothetical protein